MPEKTFKKTKIFCVNCGKQTVLEDDLDDYYAGCGFHCFSCYTTFYMQSRDMDETEKAAVAREGNVDARKIKTY